MLRFSRRPLRVIASLVTLLFLLGAVVACADLPPLADLPVPVGQATTLSDGVTITPMEVEPAEWAEILNIQRWKFGVAAEPDTEVRFRLAVQVPDEAPLILAGFSIVTSDSFDGNTMIALYPIGDDFYHADELKYYVRSGSASTSKTFENIFQGWSALQPIQPPRLLADGTYELIVFSRDGTFPDPDNARIVFGASASETAP
jgi:hypothetical protein